MPRRSVEGADDFPIIARDKLLNLRLAFDQDRQRGRLHAADGGFEKSAELRVEGRHGPRAVDADQPIRFGPARRGIGQRLHGRVVTQRGKAIADGRRCHRLQPQPLDGLFGFRVADDIAEDQLPFPPGVTRVDERRHVFAFDQFREDFQARLAFLDGLEVEMRRDDRQAFERPLAPHGLDARRGHDGEQMADGRRDHVLLVLEVVIHPLKSTQRFGDIAGDGRLLRDD